MSSLPAKLSALCILAQVVGCNEKDSVRKPTEGVSWPPEPVLSRTASVSPPSTLESTDLVAVPVGREARLGSDFPDRWSSRCAVQKACASLKALPRCASNLAVLDSLPASSIDSRQPVALRGRLALSTVTTTAVACKEPSVREPRKNCCNSVGASALIRCGETAVRLDSLGCAGDESRLCCNTPAFGQAVVAMGTLRPAENSGQSPSWELLNPNICLETP